VTTIVDRERSTVNPPTARASPPSLLSASSVNEAEELAATHAAIDTSELNAVCHTDREAAIDAARDADVSLPFGGVPVGVKELTKVQG